MATPVIPETGSQPFLQACPDLGIGQHHHVLAGEAVAGDQHLGHGADVVDRALERQSVQKRLDTAADLAADSVARRLNSIEQRLGEHTPLVTVKRWKSVPSRDRRSMFGVCT